MKLKLALACLLLTLGQAWGLTIQEVVKISGPAVVVVEEEGEIIGSGVMVSPDGILITADHVIDGSKELSIKLLDGRKLPIERRIYRDARQDLAVLQVSGKGLPYVSLVDPATVAIGQEVVAIGNPQGFANTVSDGIISGKMPITGVPEKDKDKFKFVFSAPISPGSSGGGLFDREGRLIAITIASRRNSQNLNIATPARYADLEQMARLDAAIAARPADASNYLGRGELSRQLGDYELALLDFAKALQLDRSLAAAHIGRAKTFYHQGRFSDAVAEATSSIELDGSNAEAFFVRGDSLDELGNRPQAITDLVKATELNPSHLVAQRYLGLLYRDERDYDKALRQANRVLELNPNYCSYYLDRAEAYRGKDPKDASGKAREDYLKSIELDPDEVLAMVGLARISYTRDDLPRSLEWLDKALEVNSSNHLALTYRGRVLIELGRYSEAIKDLDRARELNSKSAFVCYLLADAYSRGKDLNNALQSADHAVKLDSDNPDYRRFRGELLTKAGQLNAAIQDLTAVLAASPQDQEARYWRAEAYRAKKDLAKAAADYKACIQLNPKAGLSKLAQKRLQSLK